MATAIQPLRPGMLNSLKELNHTDINIMQETNLYVKNNSYVTGIQRKIKKFLRFTHRAAWFVSQIVASVPSMEETT